MRIKCFWKTDCWLYWALLITKEEITFVPSWKLGVKRSLLFEKSDKRKETRNSELSFLVKTPVQSKRKSEGDEYQKNMMNEGLECWKKSVRSLKGSENRVSRIMNFTDYWSYWFDKKTDVWLF